MLSFGKPQDVQRVQANDLGETSISNAGQPGQATPSFTISQPDQSSILAVGQVPTLLVTESQSSTLTVGQTSTSAGSNSAAFTNASLIESNERSSAIHINDLGRVLGMQTTREAKINFLEHVWRPDKNFSYPSFKQGQSLKNCKFQLEWMEKKSWLTYTQTNGEGALCISCVLFGGDKNAPQGGMLKAGAFCSRPFTRYKHALREMNKHEMSQMHRDSEELARQFRITVHNPQATIMSCPSEGRTRKQT